MAATKSRISGYFRREFDRVGRQQKGGSFVTGFSDRPLIFFRLEDDNAFLAHNGNFFNRLIWAVVNLLEAN